MKSNSFPANTAGRLMTERVPQVLPETIVSDIEKLFWHQAKEYDSLNYIYIVDQAQRLVGVISVKEIFRLPKNATLETMMVKELIAVRPHTDQERAALLAVKNNLKAVPVVDAGGRFLGALVADTIMEILQQENLEDLLRVGGIGLFADPARDLLRASATTHFVKRFPWLLLGLLGGFLAAAVARLYQSVLTELIILAAFLPAVLYMASAVGMQTQTIFIRSLVLAQKADLKHYWRREFFVNLALAVVLALVAGFILWWWQPLLAFILGFSFFVTINVAGLVALSLPWLFYRLGIDPAVVTGPLGTIISDLLSVGLYLGIASLVLGLTS